METNPRAPLIAAMKADAEKGLHCGSCVGTCCTFVANSMQVDEIQANDMKTWLVEQDRWNEELFVKLEECIEEFRLDREISNMRVRRTYTCPFYTGAKLGCSIAPEVKPYGCLAFNPRTTGVTNGGECRSDQALLESLDVKLVGEKKPIPVALLALR